MRGQKLLATYASSRCIQTRLPTPARPDGAGPSWERETLSGQRADFYGDIRCAIRHQIGGEGEMSKTEIENLIIGSIHGAFIKYPEGDGGPNLDYEWIASDQSAQIAKAILLDLAANGYAILKQPPDPTRSQAPDQGI